MTKITYGDDAEMGDDEFAETLLNNPSLLAGLGAGLGAGAGAGAGAGTAASQGKNKNTTQHT